MATYARVPGTTVLSNLIALQEAQHDAMRSIERGTTTPTVPVIGQLWIDTTGGVDTLKQYVTGGTWITLMVLDTANNKLGMAGRVLSNIGAASANGEALQFQQGVLRSGLLADLPAGGHKITGLGTPSSSGDAATKAYVDAASAAGAGVAAVANGTLPTRRVVVTGIGYQPKVVIAQLIKNNVADGETSDTAMAALYTSPTVAKGFMNVSCPLVSGSGSLRTLRSLWSLQIDADGFTLEYESAIRGDSTYPTLAHCQWASFR